MPVTDVFGSSRASISNHGLYGVVVERKTDGWVYSMVVVISCLPPGSYIFLDWSVRVTVVSDHLSEKNF